MPHNMEIVSWSLLWRHFTLSINRLTYLLSYLLTAFIPLGNDDVVIGVIWTQVVVGNSANWVEAAKTLTELAEQHQIKMNDPVYFVEPYVGLDEMPSLVELTYRSTRSTSRQSHTTVVVGWLSNQIK